MYRDIAKTLIALIVVLVVIMFYAKVRREKMSVGGHWGQAMTYGHSPMTLPAFGLSGYYEDVPVPTWA